MRIVRIFITVLLLGSMLQACARVPSGTEEAAATYSQGVFQTTYPTTLFRTFEAARSTLQDQGMAITNARREADEGIISAVTEDGTVLDIALRARRPDLTDISIKVGTYGSEEISREISSEIEARIRNR